MPHPTTTRITGLRRWAGFLEGLWDIVAHGVRDWQVGDRKVHGCANWFRDHIHMQKFARYFDPDPTSALQFLIDHQHPSGFFHEILTSSSDGHLNFVSEEFRRILDAPHGRPGADGSGLGAPKWALVRLELEADIEYLMVEGVARAWEATGDTAWMEAALPALEKGLLYSLTHPTRFDARHGLVKRPFTIDTWDFTWGARTSDRGIHPDTPMAIHYGDNAGVYAAAKWLGERLPDSPWSKRAKEIRRRTNAVCWNGRFYTHQVLLQPVETGGPREEEILSLSNPYAINRGLTDHGQAVSIIKEYLRLRDETKDFAVAEWFTIYPPYPIFAVHKMWDYVNGGIAPFVGGELATAAFHHGYEGYGVDIIDRLHQWWTRDGTLRFLYTKEGKRPEHDWGPPGWGAAAIGQALLEGLAGVRMNAAEKTVALTPRWAVAGEDDVTVEAVFPAAGFGIRYRYLHEADSRRIIIRCEAPGSLAVSVLMPSGAPATSVTVNGVESHFTLERIEKSHYVSLRDPATSPEGVTEVVIGYRMRE